MAKQEVPPRQPAVSIEKRKAEDAEFIKVWDEKIAALQETIANKRKSGVTTAHSALLDSLSGKLLDLHKVKDMVDPSASSKDRTGFKDSVQKEFDSFEDLVASVPNIPKQPETIEPSNESNGESDSTKTIAKLRAEITALANNLNTSEKYPNTTAAYREDQQIKLRRARLELSDLQLKAAITLTPDDERLQGIQKDIEDIQASLEKHRSTPSPVQIAEEPEVDPKSGSVRNGIEKMPSKKSKVEDTDQRDSDDKKVKGPKSAKADKTPEASADTDSNQIVTTFLAESKAAYTDITAKLAELRPDMGEKDVQMYIPKEQRLQASLEKLQQLSKNGDKREQEQLMKSIEEQMAYLDRGLKNQSIVVFNKREKAKSFAAAAVKPEPAKVVDDAKNQPAAKPESKTSSQERLSSFLQEAKTEYERLGTTFDGLRSTFSKREQESITQIGSMLGELIEDLRVMKQDGVSDSEVPTNILRRITEAKKSLTDILFQISVTKINDSKGSKVNASAENEQSNTKYFDPQYGKKGEWLSSEASEVQSDIDRSQGKRKQQLDSAAPAPATTLEAPATPDVVPGAETPEVKKVRPTFETLDLPESAIKQAQERISKIAIFGAERGVAGEVIGQTFDPVARHLNESLTKRIRYMKSADAKVAGEKLRDFMHRLGEAKSTTMTMQNSGAVMDSVANLAQEARSLDAYLDSHTAQEEVASADGEKPLTLDELAALGAAKTPETRAEKKAKLAALIKEVGSVEKDREISKLTRELEEGKTTKAFTFGDLERVTNLSESPEKKAMDKAENEHLAAVKEFYKSNNPLVRVLKRSLKTEKVRELTTLKSKVNQTRLAYQAEMIQRRKLAEVNVAPSPIFIARTRKKYEALEKQKSLPTYVNGKPATFEEFLAREQANRMEALGKGLMLRKVLRPAAMKEDEARIEALGEKAPGRFGRLMRSFSNWNKKKEEKYGESTWKAVRIVGTTSAIVAGSAAFSALFATGGVVAMTAILGFGAARIGRSLWAATAGTVVGKLTGKLGEVIAKDNKKTALNEMRTHGKDEEMYSEKDFESYDKQRSKYLTNVKQSTIDQKKAVYTAVGAFLGGAGSTYALYNLADTVTNLPCVEHALGSKGAGLAAFGTGGESHSAGVVEHLNVNHEHDFTVTVDHKLNDSDKLFGHFSKQLEGKYPGGKGMPQSVAKFLAAGGSGDHLLARVENTLTKALHFQDSNAMSAMVHPGDSLSLEGDKIVFHSKFYGNTNHVIFDGQGPHAVDLSSMHPTPPVTGGVEKAAGSPYSQAEVPAVNARISPEVVPDQSMTSPYIGTLTSDVPSPAPDNVATGMNTFDSTVGTPAANVGAIPTPFTTGSTITPNNPLAESGLPRPYTHGTPLEFKNIANSEVPLLPNNPLTESGIPRPYTQGTPLEFKNIANPDGAVPAQPYKTDFAGIQSPNEVYEPASSVPFATEHTFTGSPANVYGEHPTSLNNTAPLQVHSNVEPLTSADANVPRLTQEQIDSTIGNSHTSSAPIHESMPNVNPFNVDLSKPQILKDINNNFFSHIVRTDDINKNSDLAYNLAVNSSLENPKVPIHWINETKDAFGNIKQEVFAVTYDPAIAATPQDVIKQMPPIPKDADLRLAK